MANTTIVKVADHNNEIHAIDITGTTVFNVISPNAQVWADVMQCVSCAFGYHQAMTWLLEEHNVYITENQYHAVNTIFDEMVYVDTCLYPSANDVIAED